MSATNLSSGSWPMLCAAPWFSPCHYSAPIGGNEASKYYRQRNLARCPIRAPNRKKSHLTYYNAHPREQFAAGIGERSAQNK